MKEQGDGGNLHHTVLGILCGKKNTLVSGAFMAFVASEWGFHGFRCKRWVTLHHAEERKRGHRFSGNVPHLVL